MSDNTEITILTKLTLKGIGCVPEVAKVEKKEVALAHLYGIASGTTVKKAPNGDVFIGITGEFEAVNLADGKVFRSGIIYLPGGIHESLVAALVPGADGKVSPVDFGIEIMSRPDSNPIGYGYAARELVKVERADPLAKMRALIAPKTQAALPKPEHAHKEPEVKK